MECGDAAALPRNGRGELGKEGLRRQTRTELGGRSAAGGKRDTGERDLTGKIIAPRCRNRGDANTAERWQHSDETTRDVEAKVGGGATKRVVARPRGRQLVRLVP